MDYDGAMMEQIFGTYAWPLAFAVVAIAALLIFRKPINSVIGRIRVVAAQDRAARKQTSQVFRFALTIPTVFNVILLIASFFLRAKFDSTIWPFWFIGLGSFAAAVSTFQAYFHDDISNVAAWVSIFLNGAIFICVFAVIHSSVGILYAGADTVLHGTILHDLPSALYFSIVSFTTLGYGDFQPTESLRLLAAAEALLGYIFLGLIVGTVIHHASEKRGENGSG